MKALTRNARHLLARPEPLPKVVQPPVVDPALLLRNKGRMRGLHAEPCELPDCRRSQGLSSGARHPIASVLAIHVLATLSDLPGCVAVTRFATSLTQAQLQALGAW